MPRRTLDATVDVDTSADTPVAADTSATDDAPSAVANPPAGGDQTQASTNDDNQNTVLQTAPAVVVASANRQAGVVSRFPDRAAADNDAAARREKVEGTKFTVMDESELPEFVARVEAGEDV